MRRKFMILSVLCAWLIATGSQWDMVQVFAWGKMIVTYSRIMPVRDAIALTFTPGNLCGVCKLVSDAKTREETVPGAEKAPEKPLILCKQPVLVVEAPVPEMSRLAERPCALGIDRAAPPLPPPRAEAA